MRSATILTLAVLMAGIVHAQTEATSDAGHFEGWPDSPPWGADKQTFEATTAVIRKALGLLTVSENGFGWRRAFTDSKDSFNQWAEISAWCPAAESLFIRLDDARASIGYYDISSDDLKTIVDEYLRKYASEQESRGPDFECTADALRLPDERDRIIELLKAASSESR